MKRSVLLFVLGLFLSCSSSNIGTIKMPKKFKQGNSKKYADMYNAMRFQVPDSWVSNPTDPHHFTIRYTPQKLKDASYTNSSAVYAKAYELVDDSQQSFINGTKDLLNSIATGFDNYKTLEMSVEENPKDIGVFYEYEYKGFKIKGYSRFIKEKDVLYELIYLGQENQYNLYWKEARSLIDSFYLETD